MNATDHLRRIADDLGLTTSAFDALIVRQAADAITWLRSENDRLQGELEVLRAARPRPPALPKDGDRVYDVDRGTIVGWEQGHWTDVEGEDVRFLGSASWTGPAAEYWANSAQTGALEITQKHEKESE